MMGPSHALSGAAVWLAGSWIAAVAALFTMISIVWVLKALRAASTSVVPNSGFEASACTAMACTPSSFILATTSAAGPALEL